MEVFCASCFSPVAEQLEICPTCGVALATGEVSKRVPAEGPNRGRRARVPSLLLVIGMWLIVLPALFVAFGMGIGPVEGRIRTRIFVGLVFWAYGSVLYKITSRYIEARRS